MTNIKWVLFDVQASLKLFKDDRDSFHKVMDLLMEFIDNGEIDLDQIPLTDKEYHALRAILERVTQGMKNWTDYSNRKKEQYGKH